MKRSEAMRFRRQIEADGAKKTDAEALEAMLYYPVWGVGRTYKADDRVRYKGELYKCLTAHTSQESWMPDVSPSLFARVLIPDPDVIPDWIQPGSTNPYSRGDKVRFNGKVWVSVMDGNVWAPGVYGWEEVEA